MERPVSRSQSPISAANPNAVSVETPRRQPSRVHHRGEYRIGGHRLDRAVQPIAAIHGGQHRVEGGVVGQLQAGVSNRCVRSHSSCLPVQALPP